MNSFISIGKPRRFPLTREALVDFTFIVYFSYTALVAFSGTAFSVLRLPPRSAAILNITLMGLVFACVLLTPWINLADTIILYVLIALTFAGSLMLNPALRPWLNNPTWGVINRMLRIDRGLYAYLMIRLVRDPKRILKNLYVCAWIWALYLFLQGIGRIRAGSWEKLSNDGETVKDMAYNMAYGYQCLFAATVFFARFRMEKRLPHLLVGAVLTAFGILYGSRGAVLVAGVFFMILIFRAFITEKRAKWVVLFLLILLMTVCLFLFFDKILLFLSGFLNLLGVKSRNLLALAEGSIGDTTDRQNIWGISKDMIAARFPFGYGAFGDRPGVGARYAWGYSHSILLELTVSFGIFGIAILVLLLAGSVYMILRCRHREWLILFVIFFSSSVKLAVSDSFWFLPYFWAALAVMVSWAEEEGKTITTLKFIP